MRVLSGWTGCLQQWSNFEGYFKSFEAAANVLAETERGSKGGKGLEIAIKVDLKADDMRLLNRVKQKIKKKVEIISIK